MISFDAQAIQLGRALNEAGIEQKLQRCEHPRQVALQYPPLKLLFSRERLPLYWQSLKFLRAALLLLQRLKAV